MKSIYYIAIILLLVAGGGCHRSEDDTTSVRIGLIAYTEDVHRESVGEPTLNAARLAVEEINSLGGVKLEAGSTPVELVVEGIASSPQNAVASVRKLTNQEKVVAIVGLHYSIDAIPAGAFADKARTPFISPMSTNAQTTQGREYVFRMSFVDEQQGSVMARFAFNDLGVRRAAVMFDRSDPYSSGISDVFAKVFIEQGGVVVAYKPFVPESADYDELFRQIGQLRPDVLYLPGFAADVTKQALLARKHGLNVRLLGGDGWNAEKFSQITEFNDSYFTSHWVSGQGLGKAENFVTHYQEKFGQKPDAVAALTYDAMQILFAAIEHVGRADSEAIRQSLVDMGIFEGVTGNVDFVDNGDPVKGVLVLHLRDGSVVLERVVDRGEY